MDTVQISNEQNIKAIFHSPFIFGYEDNDFGYSVTLMADGLETTKVIYNISYFSDPSNFFNELAECKDRWNECKSWFSLEDDLQITATYDSNKIVQLDIMVISQDYYRASWEAKISLEIELNDCQRIAEELKDLLCGKDLEIKK